ncbi:hypothetical protein K7432_000002 [Basidiobolus ranarum]|uniref:DUF7905 domain-containing protein n=1 Tax=Basidiobolus ranarum TaxID=34480 RepID=A0ABR2WBV0_9FUNG
MSSSSYYFTIQALHNWSQESLNDIQNKIQHVEVSTDTNVNFVSQTNAFKIRGSTYEKVDSATKEIMKIINISLKQEQRSRVKFENPITPTYSFTGKNTLKHQNVDEPVVRKRSREDAKNPSRVKEVTKSFLFHPDIEDPWKILVPQSETNYLEEISQSTKTTALLEDRTVTITGTSLECIEEALARLENLQYRALQAPYRYQHIPLVHYPHIQDRFKLYFVNFTTAGINLTFPFTRKHILSEIYLLLPVTEDRKTGLWSGPDDIHLSSLNKIISCQNALTKSSLNRAESMAVVQERKVPIVRISWKDIDKFHSDEVDEHSAYHTLAKEIDRSPSNLDSTSADIDSDMSEKPDFMSLDHNTGHKTNSKSAYGISNEAEKRFNKSHDILKQESPGKMLKDYNFNQIKSAFYSGLDYVRYFQGEVSLEARLGKVAYRNLKPELMKKLWEYSDLKNILLEEMELRPIFSNIVATEYKTIRHLIERLGTGNPRHPYYVIEADARSSTNTHYCPVRLHINVNMVKLEKVVTKKDRVLDIDWNSLSRVYDFQLKIWTRKHLRHDAKPYSTFLKNISINRDDLRITYKDIPNFIRVKRIKLKKKIFYKINDHFTLELTFVTLLNSNESFCGRMEADPSKGESYFTMRVSSHFWDSRTCHNLSLSPGDVPSWSVDELVGGPTCRHLIQLVRTMIILVEQAQTQRHDA